jgi:hypothetical protein
VCLSSLFGLAFTFPAKLSVESAATSDSKTSMVSLRRIDIVGSALLLGSCILLSTGLQQAALGYGWTSSLVLPLLLVSSPIIAAFLTWEWFVTKREIPEPVFPWRFCQSRICLGMILNSFLSGSVLLICLVQIPQRFITVNGLSPKQAAVRFLAFGAFVPSGSTIGAALMNKLKIPAAVIIAVGASLQLIGAVFLSRIPTGSHLHQAQYGYQVLLGIGVGFVMVGLILLVPFAMEKRDLGKSYCRCISFLISAHSS